jgi:hypothetical protein
MITDPQELAECANELEEIKDQIMGLIEQARNTVRNTPEENRAESYWLAHLEMALTKESRYLGSSMITMECTINDLRNDADQGED